MNRSVRDNRGLPNIIPTPMDPTSGFATSGGDGSTAPLTGRRLHVEAPARSVGIFMTAEDRGVD
jgi:hypothetical protein